MTSRPGRDVVGVVANPASGRDIRRLVTGASVFDNVEKGSMVLRLLAGLGATGVERVVMMPAGDGLGTRVAHGLAQRTGALARQPVPSVEVLDMPLRGSAQDTIAAVREMVRRRVAAIVVLGGDGTHRAVATACRDTPVCALSTGTNNAFPGLSEATIAGLATGLVATGRVGAAALRREKLLHVDVSGDPVAHVGVVDVAVTTSRFIGARALWHAGGIREFLVAFADPSAIGLAGIAGLLEPVGRAEEFGLHVRLTDPATATSVVTAPLAPGLIAELGVAEFRRIGLREATTIERPCGSLALDGEREIELRGDDAVEIRLGLGPLTIDVDEVMRQAAQRRLLLQAASGRQSGDVREKEAVA